MPDTTPGSGRAVRRTGGYGPQGFGIAPKTICSWFVQIKKGKFVPYPNAKPRRGNLIPASTSGS